MNSATLPTTGNYTVVITPQNGNTGSVGVTLSLFQQPTGTIAPGVPAKLVVDTPGQTATLTFSGTAGQMASVLWSNCALSVIVPGTCDSGTFTILNPNGSTLNASTIAAAGSSLLAPLTLPVTGTYTLEFTPQNGAVGTAGATVWLYSEQVGSVTASTPAPPLITINSPQQYMQLTFSAQAQQSVSLSLTNSTFAFSSCNGIALCSLSVNIYNPGGSLLTSAELSYSNLVPPTSLVVGPVTVATTGTYTVDIVPYVGVTPIVNLGSANMSLTVQ